MFHRTATAFCLVCYLLLRKTSSCTTNKTAPAVQELSSNVYLKFIIIGIATCSDKCQMVSHCNSYDYNSNSLTCLIYTSQAGMYKKKSATETCSKLSCSKTSVCLQRRSGQTVCVSDIYLCGDAPVVKHSSKTVIGYHRNAVITYTCYPDYTPCLTPMTSTCQPSGKWKDVSGECAQFRWRNPKLRVRYQIPCGASSLFKVTVLAKATRRRRFSVFVLTEKEPLLVCAFLLNHDGFTNRLGLNSRLNGKWIGGYAVPLDLKVGKEVRITIGFNHGVFTIQANETPECNYTVKTVMSPQSVRVNLDAKVDLIEFTRRGF